MRKTRLRHLETLIKSWDAKRQYSWRQSWQQTLRNAIVKINIVVYTNYQSPLVSFIVRHFIGDLRHRPRLYSSSSIRLGKKPMKVDGELIHTFRLVCWLSRNPFWPSFTCSSFLQAQIPISILRCQRKRKTAVWIRRTRTFPVQVLLANWRHSLIAEGIQWLFINFIVERILCIVFGSNGAQWNDQIFIVN